MIPENLNEETDGGLPPRTGSPSSDTPETDAIITRLFSETGHVGQHNCPEEWVKHARKLERERDAAHHALIKIRDLEEDDRGDPWATLDAIAAIAHNAIYADNADVDARGK